MVTNNRERGRVKKIRDRGSVRDSEVSTWDHRPEGRTWLANLERKTTKIINYKDNKVNSPKLKKAYNSW